MLVAAFTLAGLALVVALIALIAALDAREFWRALLDDYRAGPRVQTREDWWRRDPLRGPGR